MQILKRKTFLAAAAAVLCVLSAAVWAIAQLTHRGGTLYRDKVAVIMWHHLDPSVNGKSIMKPEQFAAQLDLLTRKGIHFITLQQFRSFMQGGPVPDNAALVTFDDGYESFYRYAYPILRQRSIGGVCFVITGDLGPHPFVNFPHMKPGEIKDMVRSDPQIEVQAHTDNLHYKISPRSDALTGLITSKGVVETEDRYLERIRMDTQICVAKLKPLNSYPIDAFAYPYGLHTPIVEHVLQQAGIRYAFTVKPGLVARRSDAMLLPRLNGGSPLISPERLYRNLKAAVRGSAH